jgi:hypothetical protein
LIATLRRTYGDSFARDMPEDSKLVDVLHRLGRAGGMWEPGSRRWLVTRHRIGPVIRALERETDPLFRHAGMSLD